MLEKNHIQLGGIGLTVYYLSFGTAFMGLRSDNLSPKMEPNYSYMHFVWV
jgi:hypothetical protein